MQSQVMSATARPAPETSLKAILRLAGPLFLANLAVVGNGTIDAVMAGRLSATDMAGVAVASSVYITVYIGFMAVLQALSPIAGHHFGAQRWRQIGDDVQQALWLAGALAVAAVPSLLATGFWIGLAGVDGKVAAVTETYLHAVAFGVPAGLATRVYVALNAAVSRPTVTMVVNLTVLALKAPLNAVFMYGAGPIAPMGGAGAGVATAILAWLALLLSAGIWRFDRFYDRFRSDSIHGPRLSSLKELLKLGLPIGLSSVFEITSFTLMAVLIARIGAAAVAGHQIVANLVALLFMVPLSLGIATSVLVAQSLGAGAPRAARRVTGLGYSIAMAAAVSAALTALGAARVDRRSVHDRRQRRRGCALAAGHRGVVPRVRRGTGHEQLRAARIPADVLADVDLWRRAVGSRPRRGNVDRFLRHAVRPATRRIRVLARRARGPRRCSRCARLPDAPDRRCRGRQPRLGADLEAIRR